ncbi:MAG: hypothetical protein HC933_02800 [Pleurocapsa sp. SU_196_0]|nr:hypothetical protein [Pleurocapsa sp. SU_196_0]
MFIVSCADLKVTFPAQPLTVTLNSSSSSVTAPNLTLTASVGFSAEPCCQNATVEFLENGVRRAACQPTQRFPRLTRANAQPFEYSAALSFTVAQNGRHEYTARVVFVDARSGATKELLSTPVVVNVNLP